MHIYIHFVVIVLHTCVYDFEHTSLGWIQKSRFTLYRWLATVVSMIFLNLYYTRCTHMMQRTRDTENSSVETSLFYPRVCIGTLCNPLIIFYPHVVSGDDEIWCVLNTLQPRPPCGRLSSDRWLRRYVYFFTNLNNAADGTYVGACGLGKHPITELLRGAYTASDPSRWLWCWWCMMAGRETEKKIVVIKHCIAFADVNDTGPYYNE